MNVTDYQKTAKHPLDSLPMMNAPLLKLAFQILFSPGADRLNDMELQRIQNLSRYLREQTDLIVVLDGHADPRGTDEYNNVLSQERAKAIKAAFLEMGIDTERIVCCGHGASRSSAGKGDLEGYSKERRVDLQILEPAYSKALRTACNN